jgi:uncharacterized protein
MPATFTLDSATDIRNQNGAPGWFELVTTDPEAAGAFLTQTFGWELTDYESMPGYKLINVQGYSVGGIRGPMDESEDPGPRWVTYLAVDDADDTVSKAQAAGGQVLMPATDMAEVGRMAIVSHAASGPMYFMQYVRPFG